MRYRWILVTVISNGENRCEVLKPVFGVYATGW